MSKKPETVNREDLNFRKDILMYKKYARVPFTGISENLRHLYIGELSTVRFYENGQLKEETNYENGELHGPYESYFEDGQLWTKGTFEDGVECGEWFQDGENLTHPPCVSS